MDKQTFSKLIRQPEKFTDKEKAQLEKLIVTFPYCQIAHILLAKAFNDSDDMLAHVKLRHAALYTSNRKNLREVIKSVPKAPPVESLEAQESKDDVKPLPASDNVSTTNENEITRKTAAKPHHKTETENKPAFQQTPDKANTDAGKSIIESKEIKNEPEATSDYIEATPPVEQQESKTHHDELSTTLAEMQKMRELAQSKIEEASTEVKEQEKEQQLVTAKDAVAVDSNTPKSQTAQNKDGETNKTAETRSETSEATSEKEDTKDQIAEPLPTDPNKTFKEEALQISDKNQAKKAVEKRAKNVKKATKKGKTFQRAGKEGERSNNNEVAHKLEATLDKLRKAKEQSIHKSKETPTERNEDAKLTASKDGPTKVKDNKNKAQKERKTQKEQKAKEQTPESDETPAIGTKSASVYTSRLGSVMEHEENIHDNVIEYADLMLLFLESEKEQQVGSQNQEEIIETFIRNEPTISRITPAETKSSNTDFSKPSSVENKQIVTENLAKINAKQGNIQKAIDIYRQLILKFPKKKSYFVAEIDKLND